MLRTLYSGKKKMSHYAKKIMEMLLLPHSRLMFSTSFILQLAGVVVEVNNKSTTHFKRNMGQI